MQEIPNLQMHELGALASTQTLILTVNNRFARRIVETLQRSLPTGQRTMEVPEIMPVGAWLRQLADELCFSDDFAPAAHVLDSFGSHYTWEQAIREVEAAAEGEGLLDMRQAASLASEADGLLDDWRITVVEPEYSPDYERFLRWRERYQQHLQDFDLDDANRSANRVLHALQAAALTPPFSTLVLAGFHELSPRFSLLLEALQQQGVQCYQLTPPALETVEEPVQVAAHDTDHEWRLAVQWAVEQLRAKPASKVAIVAAQLEKNVPLVHRLLSVACRGDGEQVPDLAWNVAVARPLTEWPLVRAALAWLEVMAALHRNQSVEASILGKALLAGACAGSTSEASARAVWDVNLRQWGEVTVGKLEWETGVAERLPVFSPAWDAAWAHLQQQPTRQSALGWAQCIRVLLQQLGFPGQESLDSHAFQVMEAFDARLGQFAQQTPVLSTLSFGRALSLLTRLLRETAFQPQRDPSARLDVLGMLEAEGGQWDAIWLLGLSDEVLPAAVRPNPFIPYSALRRVNAPRSTPERELQWARYLFSALCSSAQTVWVSYPQYQGEQLLRPSPLLKALAQQDYALPDADTTAQVLERVQDEHGPALSSDEKVRGGAGVLDTQARSPLWAFVKYRLSAAVLPRYAQVGEQNVRGEFLHSAIERIWKACTPPTQAGLQTWLTQHPEGVTDCIHNAAKETLQAYSERLRVLECERAEQVLRGWLAFELERPAFEVKAIEKPIVCSYQNLRLSMRLDRLDQLADGSVVVLDYKTSLNRRNPLDDWLRARPIELQLPLYAGQLQMEGEQVSGAALAWLNTRAPGVTGYAQQPLGDVMTPESASKKYALPDWETQVQQWQQSISALAAEFCAGYAANQLWNEQDLMFCDVLPMLRLNEVQDDHA